MNYSNLRNLMNTNPYLYKLTINALQVFLSYIIYFSYFNIKLLSLIY